MKQAKTTRTSKYSHLDQQILLLAQTYKTLKKPLTFNDIVACMKIIVSIDKTLLAGRDIDIYSSNFWRLIDGRLTYLRKHNKIKYNASISSWITI